jgi:outer membrane lipoprotein-sorting protein
LCKFFTGWKALKSYSYEGTTTQSDGKKTVSTIKAEGDDKFYMKLSGDTTYEIIQIGNVLYTKAADGTWWKQTLPETDADKYKGNNDVDFTEPDTENDGVTYKKIGTEKCGVLTCFKYQVVDPGNTSTTTYVWFDDKDYQLRRMQTTTPEYTWDSTYSYGNVSVSEPSPVKELGPNQYIVPGQSEPTTLPSVGDSPSEEVNQLMQQYY